MPFVSWTASGAVRREAAATIPTVPFASLSTSAKTERVTSADVSPQTLSNICRAHVDIVRVCAPIQPDRHINAGNMLRRRPFGVEYEGCWRRAAPREHSDLGVGECVMNKEWGERMLRAPRSY